MGSGGTETRDGKIGGRVGHCGRARRVGRVLDGQVAGAYRIMMLPGLNVRVIPRDKA